MEFGAPNGSRYSLFGLNFRHFLGSCLRADSLTEPKQRLVVKPTVYFSLIKINFTSRISYVELNVVDSSARVSEKPPFFCF